MSVINQKITPILILAILVVSVFGFFGMSHDGKSCDPFASDSTCPPTEVAMASHHLFYYSNLTIAILSPAVTAAFSMLLLLVVAFVFTRYVALKQKMFLLRLYARGDSTSSSQYRKIMRWLSLFENSPAL
jgi:hypothetical protein